MEKLTKAQERALTKLQLEPGKWHSSYHWQESRGTLDSLVARGLIQHRTVAGVLFSPRSGNEYRFLDDETKTKELAVSFEKKINEALQKIAEGTVILDRASKYTNCKRFIIAGDLLRKTLEEVTALNEVVGKLKAVRE